jgi:uncharacterized membrane protein YfcA
MEIALILAILLVAGAVQGTTGFGFGLVSVALLGAVMPVRDASVMLVLGSLSINIFMFVRLRSHFRTERVLPAIGAAVVGVPLGVWLLVRADETVLRRILGLILIATVVQRLLPALARKRWHPIWLGVPCGLLAGGLSGAFNTGGPPIVAYVSSQGFDRFRYAAAVQLLLGISAVTRIGCLTVAGAFTPRLAGLGAAGILCAVGGAWLGMHGLRRLSDRAVSRIVLVMLIALAVKYLVT